MSDLTSEIKETNDEYKKFSGTWEKIRDCISGQDAVHGKTVKYLPKLSNQSEEDYKNYMERAVFFNATSKVQEAILGLLFRKDPVIEPDDEPAKPFIEDITLSGESLYSLTMRVAEEVVSVNRIGVLVDFPEVSEAPITASEEQESNLRPYLRTYSAESILDWREGAVNNKTVLTYVKVREESYVISSDGISQVKEIKYRVLDLEPGTLVYRQRVYRELENGEIVQDGTDMYPKMSGKPMYKIPFEFIDSRDALSEINKPNLIDLVNVNISHYKSVADYEHGLHFTALPTAVITGVTNEDISGGMISGEDDVSDVPLADRDDAGLTEPSFSIGSQIAWVLPQADAKAFYLEFSGKGLSFVENAITKKETQMAKLGARILQDEKNQAESGEALAIRQQSETSILSSTSRSVTNGMNKVLAILSEWAGLTTHITIKLNTDFISSKLSSQEVTSLLGVYMAGEISGETFFNTLIEGEYISTNRTYEQEQDVIGDQEPKPTTPLPLADAE